MNEYYVYMLTNRWKTVLYTGVTNFETYNEIAQAIAREKQIKGWTRAKKNALVAKTNPQWNDLSAAWYSPESAGSSLRSG